MESANDVNLINQVPNTVPLVKKERTRKIINYKRSDEGEMEMVSESNVIIQEGEKMFSYRCKECGWERRTYSCDVIVHECEKCGSNDVVREKISETIDIHQLKGGDKMETELEKINKALKKVTEMEKKVDAMGNSKNQTKGLVGTRTQNIPTVTEEGYIVAPAGTGAGFEMYADYGTLTEVNGKKLLRLVR